MFSTKSNVIELTPSSFVNKKVIHPKSKGKSMIFYGAPWCSHCKTASPEYSKASNTLGSGFSMFYVNCEKYPEIAERVGVKGYPTILFMNNGISQKIFSGERTTEGFLKEICKEAMKCV